MTSSPLRGFIELLALIALLTLYLLLVQWSSIPAAVPSHFGSAGSPNHMGSKNGLFLWPILGTGLYAILTFLATRPDLFNYAVPITPANQSAQIRLATGLLALVKFEVLAMFAYIEWRIIQVARGQAHGLGSEFLYIAIGIPFLTAGSAILAAYRAR